MQQTAEDPDLKKEAETIKGEDNEKVEEISVEVGDDKDDNEDSADVEIELDYNDPTILRLLRVSIRIEF